MLSHFPLSAPLVQSLLDNFFVITINHIITSLLNNRFFFHQSHFVPHSQNKRAGISKKNYVALACCMGVVVIVPVN